MGKLKTVIKKYFYIEYEKDLKRNKLTLCDHEMLYYVLKDLSAGKSSQCISQRVAEWCKRNGLTVIDPHDYEVNYTIIV